MQKTFKKDLERRKVAGEQIHKDVQNTFWDYIEPEVIDSIYRNLMNCKDIFFKNNEIIQERWCGMIPVIEEEQKYDIKYIHFIIIIKDKNSFNITFKDLDNKGNFEIKVKKYPKLKSIFKQKKNTLTKVCQKTAICG